MELARDERLNNFARLGLITNPFEPPADGSSDPLGVRLAVHAAANSLLAALEFAVTDPDRKPIVVEKSPEIPAYYNIAAIAQLFSAVAGDDPVPGIVQAYIPLDMMRIGRVRAPLGVVAERVSGPDVELTIAAWSRIALTDVDHDLPESEELAEIEAAVAQIDLDSASFTEHVFGAPDARRAGAEDPEMMMRVATSRTARLDTDPSEEDAAGLADSSDISDEATDDPMADAFVTPMSDVGSDSDGAPELQGAKPSRDAVLAEYILAYTTTHLSPVVARGIRAYMAQGTDAMAQELKVSKAPTKTLAALLRFAETRARLGALLYDNFDIWPSVPADLRHKIVATFSQLRWSLKDVGVLVFLLTPGSAPEVEEAFASGRHISWEFSELHTVAEAGCVFDATVAATWLKSASLNGEMPEWGDPLIEAIPANTLLDSACRALAHEIDHAAAAGVLPDPGALSGADIERGEAAIA